MHDGDDESCAHLPDRLDFDLERFPGCTDLLEELLHTALTCEIPSLGQRARRRPSHRVSNHLDDRRDISTTKRFICTAHYLDIVSHLISSITFTHGFANLQCSSRPSMSVERIEHPMGPRELHLGFARDTELSFDNRHESLLGKLVECLFGFPHVHHMDTVVAHPCDMEDRSLGRLLLPSNPFTSLVIVPEINLGPNHLHDNCHCCTPLLVDIAPDTTPPIGPLGLTRRGPRSLPSGSGPSR